jgi:diguanylate cyclase (GGDEF)-like protein
MYRVLACLTIQHDYRLLVLALLVCTIASVSAFVIYARVRDPRGYLGRRWLAVAGFCTGGAIWATHFIAMLAFAGKTPTAYEPILTMSSLLIACVLTIIGFNVASAGERGSIAGGAIIGLGAAAMHFTGMKAVIVAGAIHFDPDFVAGSILLGMAFTATAMFAFHRMRGAEAIAWGAGLVTLGIAVLHSTAMAAVTIVPDPTVSVPILRLSNAALAIAIVAITLLVVGAGFAASALESRAAREMALSARELVNVATDALVLARDGVIVDANRRAAELSGNTLDGLIGRRIFGDLVTCQPPESGFDEIFSLETYLKAADGASIPVEITRQPLHSFTSATEAYAISDLRPLIQTTDRLKGMNDALQSRERESRTQNMRFDTALTHMKQGLCMYDGEQRIVICNRRYGELYGLSMDQLQPGTTLQEVVERRIANGLFAGPTPDDYRRTHLVTKSQDLDLIEELNDGRCVAISRRLMPGGGWVSTHEDVTERRRIEAQLEHMAHHDPLTDLPNRALLRQKLELALTGSRHGDRHLAVLMLDLDRFKEVNDTLGHLAGDALLKAIGGRLLHAVRNTAVVARFGGDEFAIVETLFPVDDPEALPRRIQEVVGAPLELDGHHVCVGTSIGIAVAPLHGTDPDELLKKADLALYREKSDARGTFRFYEPEMSAALQERRELENDLRLALPSGQLDLHYQPIVNLERDEITGFEALMRWKHPAKGMVSPAAFIPLAEETGLITMLTEWVLLEACAEAMKWPAHIKVAVNMSVSQFKSRNMMPAVVAALAKTRLPPDRLELEITETLMLNDAESIFASFRQLRQLGVRIVLDDFGTGFSSLSYLLRFPFDKIKIDQSFIAGLAREGHSIVLVRSLIQMGLGLGVDVTAEGIETQQQLDLVRAEGCTEIQGNLISPARPASEIRHRQFRPVIQREAAVA